MKVKPPITIDTEKRAEPCGCAVYTTILSSLRGLLYKKVAVVGRRRVYYPTHTHLKA